MGAMKEHYMTLAYELTSQLTQGCVFELQAVLDEFENAFNNDWLDTDWLPEADEITLYDVAFYCVITGATLDSLLIDEFLKSCNLPVIGLYGKERRAEGV